MQQLEIQYFFPLTEQIPLDLDFSKCEEFENQKRAVQFSNDIISTSFINTSVYPNGATAISLTADHIDWGNSTRLGNWEIENSKKTPGTLQKFFMDKVFGMKWMGK